MLEIENTTSDINFVRSVTLPIIAHSHIGQSDIHGFGLFSDRNIEKDDVLCFLDGQVIAKSKYDKIQKIVSTGLGDYQKYFFMECNYLDEKNILARSLRTSYSYINHSIMPNVVLKYFPMRIVALSNISKKTEITIDYRKEPLTDEYLKRDDKTFLKGNV